MPDIKNPLVIIIGAQNEIDLILQGKYGVLTVEQITAIMDGTYTIEGED